MSYADFDDDFEQADMPANEEAPCGVYQCEITRFYENTTQNGTPRLNCILQIVSGEHTGKVIYKGWLLTTSAMSYIKADFKRFGLPVETKRFSELMPRLNKEVIGKWCEAVKKQKDDYANVYINAMIEPLTKPKHAGQASPATNQTPYTSDDANATTPESDDDVPF